MENGHKNQLPMVDLFAGAGGLTQGLSDAGFTPVAASEWDPDAASTYIRHHRQAHPSIPLKFFEGDVADQSFKSLKGHISLVAGGPPCQPYSMGGLRRGRMDNRDGIPQFIRAISEIDPDIFVMENVPGLTQGTLKSVFHETINQLTSMGFKVTANVLHAADFGVSQKRRRLFIIGTRGGHFEWPTPSHGPQGLEDWVPAKAVISAETALGTPNTSKVTYAKKPDLRPSPYDGHLWNGGGRPIDPNGLVPTLLASMGGNKTPWVDTLNIAPEYHRYLLNGGAPRTGTVPGARRITVEEAASVQGFPTRMIWTGKQSSRYRQVGNAVPVKLANSVGIALHNTFLSKQRSF